MELLWPAAFLIIAIWLAFKPLPTTEDVPRKGEIWCRDDGSPWPKVRFEVLDVKDGWVRYSRFGRPGTESCEINSFRRLCRKCKETNP